MSAKETFQDHLDRICQYGNALKPKQYDSAAIENCKSIKQSLKQIHWKNIRALPRIGSVLNGTYHENDIQGLICAKDEERRPWNHEIITLKQGPSFDKKAKSKLDEIMRRLECLKHVPKVFLRAIDTATSLAIVEQIAEAITSSTEERKDRVYSPSVYERYCATAQGSSWTDLKCHGAGHMPLRGDLEELCASAHSLILNKLQELNGSPDCKYRASAAICDEYAIIVDIHKEPRLHLSPPSIEHTHETLESPLPFIPGPSKARQVLGWVKSTRTTAAQGTVDTDKGAVDTIKGTMDIEEGLGGEAFVSVVVKSKD